jgi:hypothetical protein
LKRHGSLVDVVADGGLLWVKVSTISEKRLLMEMAKQGWEGWDSMSEDDDDDDEDDAREASPPTDTDISILKMATRLAQAARDARVNYKHPSVVMELPRMRSRADRDADNTRYVITLAMHEYRPNNTSDAVNTAIDSVLDKISSLGIKVVCGPQAPSPTPPRALSAVVAGGAPPYWATMLYDEFSRFTPRVNIDCTVLLALASDISHGRVTAAPWFNSALRRQLEIEDRERLLPAVLWPALAGGRELVCTREAARRMCEIAGSIGTEAEKARMSVLLDEGVSEEEKRKQLRALSSHDVPDDLKLPVRVYDRVGLEDARLPAVARQVAQELTDINKSVFLFGWAEGITTITSNKTSAKVIQTMVEKHRTRDDEAGPNVYVCFPSRSLVAKEKTRKGYE